MSKSQKIFKNTVRKCVQERKIDSNPTHYSKFDTNKHEKLKEETQIGLN